MIRVGIVIFLGAVIGSMGVALYAYTQYQTNYLYGVEGEAVTVGPVEYVVTFDGVHEGSRDVAPENVFVSVRIYAENTGNERTRLSGGQFYMLDEAGKKHKAEYGEFGPGDLLLEWLEPGVPVERTTQFDIPYGEDARYQVVIRPQKEQSSTDTAIICVTNC